MAGAATIALLAASAGAGAEVAGAGVASGAESQGAQPASPKIPCDAALLQQVVPQTFSFDNDGKDTTAQIRIDSAQTLTTASKSTPYCRVDGTAVTEPADVHDIKFQV